MIVLDTNIVSALMQADVDERVARWFEDQRDDDVATTAVTVMEIRYGLERIPQGRRRTTLEADFAKLISPAHGFAVIDFDEGAAERAGAFLAHRTAIGRPASETDMMIAGIAATFGAVLATRNVRDFESLPLTIENPYAEDNGGAPTTP